MKAKKIMAAVLAGAMSIAMLAGCGGASDGGASGGGDAAKSDGAEAKGDITIQIFDKNSGTALFDDRIAQKIMEETGVNIEVINPTGDPADKLSLMLASNDYPDIVLMDRGSDLLTQYIEAGAFIPLNDLLDECGQDVKEMYGEVLNKTRYEDGKNYYLSNWYGKDPDAVAGVLMRYDLLCDLVGQERADSSEPFTQQEYIDLLKQFKEKYPQIDGVDTIALTLNGFETNYEGTIKGMFGMKDYYKDADGNLEWWTKDPNYLPMVKFLNELNQNGLIDPDWVSNNTELVNQKLSGGSVFSFFGAYWDTDSANASLRSTVGDEAVYYSYKVLGEGVSENETTYGGRSSLGWDAIGITNNCKYPEEAMKVINFLGSEEGQYLLLWGIEGEDWDYVDGVHTPHEDILEGFKTDWDGTKESTGIRRWTWFVKNGNGSDGSPYDMAGDYEPSEFSKRANANFPVDIDYWDVADYDGLVPTGGSAESLEYQKVVDIYKQTFPNMVAASSAEEVESIYQQMLSDMESAGLEDVEKIVNENYQARLELWGMAE